MSKSIKTQMENLKHPKQDALKRSINTQKNQTQTRDDWKTSVERKVSEARRIKELETEVKKLKLKIAQMSESQQSDKKTILKLENEASRLRGSKNLKIQNLEKSEIKKIKQSSEYLELLNKNSLLVSKLDTSKKTIEELKTNHLNLCNEISQVLLLTLEENFLSKAKEELYTREIKLIKEGNLSSIVNIILNINHQ